jgi:pyridoxine 5-phosphate synthase
MPRLSVNLNKIALLRNSRRTGVPDVLHFGALARSAGADGITVHPRPDERVIVLVDPDSDVVERVPLTGANGIEIYTGDYAAAALKGSPGIQLRACAAAAQAAADRRLVVNIGHDLNLENLPPLVRAIPTLAEASIGHELTADALEMGSERAVIAYKAALQSAG